MPAPNYNNKALAAVLGLVEACDPKNQPSDELLRTLVALVDRRQGLQKSKVEEFMAAFNHIDARLKKLEVVNSLGRRGRRAKEA